MRGPNFPPPRSAYTDFDMACMSLRGWCGLASMCDPDRSVLAGRCNKWGTECCVARKAVCELWNGGFCTSSLKHCSNGRFVVSGFLCSPRKVCCVKKTASFKIPPPLPVDQQFQVDPQFSVDPNPVQVDHPKDEARPVFY